MSHCDRMVDVGRRKFLGGASLAAAGAAVSTLTPTQTKAAPSAARVDYPSNRLGNVSEIASEAVTQAAKADSRIADLNRAAARIGDVVKLISSVAEQTNLLALNATIEAARAGEAGRGFAVVAQEVKALAAQTAKATDEIGAQIADMQGATADSVDAIKEISETIGRISAIASEITSGVSAQVSVVKEISANTSDAAKGTSHVAGQISAVGEGALKTGAASSQVLGSAQTLSRENVKLKDAVEKFLSTVRAA